jgi:ribosomal protein S18 acetylase RimI-like enzyme
MSTEDNHASRPPFASESRRSGDMVVRVRRIHRRDLNRVWDFLKLVFRDVNRETVEYQRPRLKQRFLEVYEEEGVEQLVFEVGEATGDGAGAEIVGYAECAFEITGTDNWMNERYFTQRDMRPLFVEELAVHPAHQGRGIGAFMLEQLEHLARVRGCTHLVLEVAENNKSALQFYRRRRFHKLDAAIFMAKRVEVDAELLPPRRLKKNRARAEGTPRASAGSGRGKKSTPPSGGQG